MLKLDLRDPDLAENAKALMELKSMRLFTEEELQEMYDKQLRKNEGNDK